MTDTYYTIEDGNGDQITTGVSEETVWPMAQRMAQERGESVFVYSSADGAETEEVTAS